MGLGAFAMGLLGAALVLAIIAATLAIVLPSAEVTLTPVTRQTGVTFTVTASTMVDEIDYAGAYVPARSVQVIVEHQSEVPTSGRASAPDGYASGEVVFANRSDSAVTIPKGTIVRTGSGETARFATTSDATVAAQVNATTRVPVLAVNPGPGSNVRALTINVIEGELATALEVVNDGPTAGGTVAEVPMVVAADQNALYDQTFAEAEAIAKEQLADELAEGEFIVPQSVDVQVMSYKYDQALDERSDVASMTIKVVARAMAIRQSDLELLASRFVESKAGEDLALISETLQLKRSDQVQVQGGEATFDVDASGAVARVIDRETIRAKLRGKEIPAASAWLSQAYDLARAPEIKIMPPKWGRLPVLPARTQITVKTSLP